jgi:pimeloyl-ACP methyl ester carboxylesterase
MPSLGGGQRGQPEEQRSAQTAYRLAARHPAAVRKLVVIGAGFTPSAPAVVIVKDADHVQSLVRPDVLRDHVLPFLAE